MSNVPENKRNPEVLAGIFLVITSIFWGASLLTNIEYISYFTSLSDDFEYLTDNLLILRVNSVLWIVSSVLMVFSSATLLVAMKPHNQITAFLVSFFFMLAAAMFCIAAIKGFSILELISYQEKKIPDLIENEYIRANILNLTREKDIFVPVSKGLTGIGLFIFGLFGFKTGRVPLIIRILCITGGIILPFTSVFSPQSILREIGLIIVFMVLLLTGIRLSFKGFVKRKKKKKKV